MKEAAVKKTEEGNAQKGQAKAGGRAARVVRWTLDESDDDIGSCWKGGGAGGGIQSLMEACADFSKAKKGEAGGSGVGSGRRLGEAMGEVAVARRGAQGVKARGKVTWRNS